MLAVPPEPEGGDALPQGPLDLELRGLRFAYAEGTFALQDVDCRQSRVQILVSGGPLQCGYQEYIADDGIEFRLRTVLEQLDGPPAGV